MLWTLLSLTLAMNLWAFIWHLGVCESDLFSGLAVVFSDREESSPCVTCLFVARRAMKVDDDQVTDVLGPELPIPVVPEPFLLRSRREAHAVNFIVAEIREEVTYVSALV